MNPTESKTIKPQEVVTIFRDVKQKSENHDYVVYPEIEKFFENGFYIEDFKQTLIGTDRYMITFTFRKFNPSTY